MLVRKAMPSITLMMSCMRCEPAWMSPMVRATSLITSPPCRAASLATATAWLAWRAAAAVSRAAPWISLMAAAVSCSCAAACWLRWARSRLPPAMASLARAISSAQARTWPTEAVSCPAMKPITCSKRSSSLRAAACGRGDRSPSAMARAAASARSRPWPMRRVTRPVTTSVSATASPASISTPRASPSALAQGSASSMPGLGARTPLRPAWATSWRCCSSAS